MAREHVVDQHAAQAVADQARAFAGEARERFDVVLMAIASAVRKDARLVSVQRAREKCHRGRGHPKAGDQHDLTPHSRWPSRAKIALARTIRAPLATR